MSAISLHCVVAANPNSQSNAILLHKSYVESLFERDMSDEEIQEMLNDGIKKAQKTETIGIKAAIILLCFLVNLIH